MYLHVSPSKQQIEQVLQAPGMAKALTGDESAKLAYVPEWSYLGLMSEEHEIYGTEHPAQDQSAKLIGYVAFSLFNSITVECHLAIMPQHWGADLGGDVAMQVDDFMQKQFQIKNYIAFIPSVCVHVIHLLERFKFKEVAHLEGMTVFSNKITDLKIFTRKVHS